MNLFAKIWASYGLLIFGLQLVLYFPFYFIGFTLFPKRSVPFLIWWAHHVMAPLTLSLSLVRRKRFGLQHINPEKSYILISNHATAIDFMINASAYPKIYQYLVKQELGKVPLFGYVISRFSILIDRREKDSRSEGYQALIKKLKNGKTVFLYPEGTRNRSAEPLGKFYPGAFRLSIETGMPILPMVLVNVRKLQRPGRFHLLPGLVRVYFLPPYHPEKLGISEVEEFVQLVKRDMANILLQKEHQPEALHPVNS